MKVKIVFIISIMFIVNSSCKKEKRAPEQLNKVNSKIEEVSSKIKESSTNIDNSNFKTENKEEELKIAFEEFKSLYYELIKFKDSERFRKYGFSTGEPYYDWLQRVKILKNKSKLLIHKGLVVGELEMLGLNYVSSKGVETKVTKFFNQAISDVISSNQ